MFNRLRKNRAQTTAEYAILIGLVVAAAVAMQTYVKRSLQGGVKYAVDKAGKSGGTGQYEPYYLETDFNTTSGAYRDTEQTLAGGQVARVYGVDADKTTTRTGRQTYKAP